MMILFKKKDMKSTTITLITLHLIKPVRINDFNLECEYAEIYIKVMFILLFRFS